MEIFVEAGWRATQYRSLTYREQVPQSENVDLRGCNIKPARRWDEAYPSGNGIMGVLAMGDPYMKP